MGIIRGILEEELKRLEELSVFYRKKISEFPRGSISLKERNGNRYIYLARREDKRSFLIISGKMFPRYGRFLTKS
jgi:hypothetical protein